MVPPILGRAAQSEELLSPTSAPPQSANQVTMAMPRRFPCFCFYSHGPATVLKVHTSLTNLFLLRIAGVLKTAFMCG